MICESLLQGLNVDMLPKAFWQRTCTLSAFKHGTKIYKTLGSKNLNICFNAHYVQERMSHAMKMDINCFWESLLSRHIVCNMKMLV